jgi:dUTP pyrophosphatase
VALKQRYTHGGVIDSGYRGEWKVMLSNDSQLIWEIKRGDRIAQVVFLPVFHPLIELVSDLGDSVRGADGFGSTGT